MNKLTRGFQSPGAKNDQSAVADRITTIRAFTQEN